MGIDLVVVDDGWFGERNDDTTSMGDWTSNPIKFPHGLKALSHEVNQIGCRFGLWFEPEMISEKSVSDCRIMLI
jgi:alpha-galactosidase